MLLRGKWAVLGNRSTAVTRDSPRGEMRSPADGEEDRMASFGPADGEWRLRSVAPDLTIVAPEQSHGWRDVLRLAAGLAQRLPGGLGRHITETADNLHIPAAHVDRVVTVAADSGALAIVEGRLLALGERSFLSKLGVKPRSVESRVADRIERSGGTTVYLVAVARGQIIGVLGVSK